MKDAPRWRTLLARREAELASLLCDTALALRARRTELATWSSLAGLPEGEALASPFGARMVALGLAAGATTVRHELRPLLPWHRRIRPRGAVADPRHGRWLRGALRTGKYEEFCAEEPFASYHPGHSSKWAPHEMLHRAVGFFAQEGASGFSRYLGARLNELLPVATWYGLEHALRLDREGPFDRAREASELEAPLAQARWLTEPERSVRMRARRAAPLLRWTLERTARELTAIDEEIAGGTIVTSADAQLEPFPGVRLDASADALAYVHAHERRLQSPAVGRALEALASQRVPTIAAMRARIDHVLDQLLFARLAIEPAAVRARIRANELLDLLLRAALVAPEHDDPGLVSRARAIARRGASAAAVERFRSELADQLCAVVGPRRAHDAVCLGLAAHDVPAKHGEPAARGWTDTRALHRGLLEVVPETARALGRAGREAIVLRLRETTARGHLAQRVRDALADLARAGDPEIVHALRELARLEERLDAPAVAEPRDRWRIPARGAPGDARVSLRAGIRIERFEHDVLALHRGRAAARRVVHVAIGHVGETPTLCELSEPLAVALQRHAWGRLARLARRIGRDALDALEEIGVLVVVPAPE
jgi:hypothetical protein